MHIVLWLQLVCNVGPLCCKSCTWCQMMMIYWSGLERRRTTDGLSSAWNVIMVNLFKSRSMCLPQQYKMFGYKNGIWYFHNKIEFKELNTYFECQAKNKLSSNLISIGIRDEIRIEYAVFRISPCYWGQSHWLLPSPHAIEDSHWLLPSPHAIEDRVTDYCHLPMLLRTESLTTAFYPCYWGQSHWLLPSPHAIEDSHWLLPSPHAIEHSHWLLPSPMLLRTIID